MKRTLLTGIALILLTSCGTQLYYWCSNKLSGVSEYEDLTYKNYDKRTPESICALLCLYEDMITNPGGLRNVPPPGICAEFGYLLLQPDTEEIFAGHATRKQKESFAEMNTSSFKALGIQMLEKEIELYPESAVFIDPLVKKFSEN